MLTFARVAKRVKVMFSQACVTHSVQLRGGGGGGVTPNVSWHRSHGRGEVVLSGEM